jgi:lipopolysaccharide export system protein LptC
MSELAERQRSSKRHWATPGGFHDRLIRLLKIALPVLIGVLAAYLALAPLTKGREFSFVLDKNKVDVAKERMRVRDARYQGVDDKGRGFTLSAQSALQLSSRDPTVAIEGISARLMLDTGPATFQAHKARYDLDANKVAIEGKVTLVSADGYKVTAANSIVDLKAQTLVTNQPALLVAPDGRRVSSRSAVINLNSRTVTSDQPVVFEAPDGYRLQTGSAAVDVDDQRMISNRPIQGKMPLGSFTAGRMTADLDDRRVLLEGRARLHIVQGGLR